MAARDSPPHPTEAQLAELAKALGRIPSGLFVLTAEHEDRRAGMLVSWVQQMCFQPPMLSVAVGKGRPIMPLISESRRFGLCQLGDDDKLLMRKFAGGVELDEDPFLGLELVHGGGVEVPVLANAMAYMECVLACHLDVEGDHDLFVGQIVGGKLNRAVDPKIHIRTNGLRY